MRFKSPNGPNPEPFILKHHKPYKMHGARLFVACICLGLCFVVVADFDQSTIGDPALFTATSSASVVVGTPNIIQLTSATANKAGQIYFNEKQVVTFGFSTEIIWESTSCGTNGGDGYVYFITIVVSFYGN